MELFCSLAAILINRKRGTEPGTARQSLRTADMAALMLSASGGLATAARPQTSTKVRSSGDMVEDSNPAHFLFSGIRRARGFFSHHALRKQQTRTCRG